MQVIDAHQHFWKYHPETHGWIDESMQDIRRDFLPGDLWKEYAQHGIDGCVAVQADQSEAENDFLLGLADAHPFIRGVVGWVDLMSMEVGARLAHYATFPKMKGFRHILQGEADRQLMLRPAFLRGIRQLQHHGFTYDILIFPDQLPYAEQLTGAFPEQPFVIDHLAKPYIKKGLLDEWKADMQLIAQHPQVQCKLSGMVTEADWHGWTYEQLVPYLDAVVEAFGVSRVMYGSDWPVCLVAAPYQDVVGVVRQYFQSFSADEQAAVFGGNAISFYQL